MKTSTFLLRRLGYSLLVLLGLSILIFIIARIVPGDPARMAVGPRAPQWVVDNLREQLFLDKPIYIQYFLWLKGVIFHLNFGESLLSHRPVAQDIVQYLPATVEIIIVALVIEIIGGILFGTLSAYYSGKWFDNLVRLVSYLGVATPAFVWAIILMLVFGYVWPVLPTLGRLSSGLAYPPTVTGLVTIDSLIAGNLSVFWDAAAHLIMPAVALALGGLAQAIRITRSSISDTLERDFIWAERAAGIPTKIIMLKYVLKASLIPTVSVIALDVAAMLGNAFLVELVFNYPGLSRYGMAAMLSKDINAIIAVIMVIGVAFVFANILVDFIVSILDPRIRLQRG